MTLSTSQCDGDVLNGIHIRSFGHRQLNARPRPPRCSTHLRMPRPSPPLPAPPPHFFPLGQKLPTTPRSNELLPTVTPNSPSGITHFWDTTSHIDTSYLDRLNDTFCACHGSRLILRCGLVRQLGSVRKHGSDHHRWCRTARQGQEAGSTLVKQSWTSIRIQHWSRTNRRLAHLAKSRRTFGGSPAEGG